MAKPIGSLLYEVRKIGKQYGFKQSLYTINFIICACKVSEKASYDDSNIFVFLIVEILFDPQFSNYLNLSVASYLDTHTLVRFLDDCTSVVPVQRIQNKETREFGGSYKVVWSKRKIYKVF